MSLLLSSNAKTAAEDSARPAQGRGFLLRLPGLIVASAIVALFARTIFMACAMLAEIPLRADIAHPEAAVVARAYDVARGDSAYQDWRHWPHAFSPYGPLTYYPCGIIGRLFAEEGLPRKLYLLGRTQAFLALIGAALMIGLISMAGRRPRAWGAVAFCCVFAWTSEAKYGVNFRPDTPALFFGLLAVLLALGSPRPTLIRAVAALLSLSASMWFKPVTWGCLSAVALALRAGRGWKYSLAAMGCFAMANLAAASLLNLFLGGRLFLNMIGSMDNGWHSDRIRIFYGDFEVLPLAIYGVGTILSVRRSLDPRWDRDRVLSLATMIAISTAHALSLKKGSGNNYFWESYALASIAFVGGLRRLWEGSATPSWRVLALRGAAPMALVLESIHLFWRETPLLLAQPKNWARADAQRVVASREGEVFVPFFPYLALERPAPPTIMDMVQYTILASRGKIDIAPLIAKIERREFNVIVTFDLDMLRQSDLGQFLPDAIVRSIRSNYSVVASGGVIVVLAPNPARLDVSAQRP